MAEGTEVFTESQRRSVAEIFAAAVDNARDELTRAPHALALSGLAAGLTMGLSGLAVAMARVSFGTGATGELLSALLYPIGFVVVIIGRSQLFTENTLYPVLLVLTDLRHLPRMLRLWGIVLAANVLGSFIFAVLAMKSGGLEGRFEAGLVAAGMDALHPQYSSVFWSAVFGGWLIALVAWMVTASHWTVGQFLVIWTLAFLVGYGHFAHCVASSGYILCAVLGGPARTGQYFHWLALAVAGNVAGGVLIVSAINYGQVERREDERRISLSERRKQSERA
jgi:formate/nitrite transporter FocA (FNT family)